MYFTYFKTSPPRHYEYVLVIYWVYPFNPFFILAKSADDLYRLHQHDTQESHKWTTDESTAQFRWESNLPSHFRQLVDSFTINQNYYEISQAGQLIVVCALSCTFQQAYQRDYSFRYPCPSQYFDIGQLAPFTKEAL